MNAFLQYVKDSYRELTEKVTWPTWEEALHQTRIVAIATLILAAVVFGVDIVFNKAIQGVFSLLNS